MQDKLQLALEIYGGIVALLTVVGTVAPKGSWISVHCARWAQDLKNVRKYVPEGK